MHGLEARASALQKALPELSAGECLRLAQELQASTMAALRKGVQHSDEMIADVVRGVARAREVKASVVRGAMVESMLGATQAFEGAAELLRHAKSLGLATVLVTDTSWHSEADTWARVAEMGITADLDHLVSSFELGARKPDPLVFRTALRKAGAAASEAVMVGDNEAADIAPAAALGMATIRVTVQFPIQGETAADATAGTLSEVGEILSRWC